MPSLRQQWHSFKNDQPGRRFQNRRERTQRAGKGRGKRIAIVAAGVLVVLVGLVMLPAPGPGIPVVALGVAMVAQGSRKVSKALDWLEVHGRSVAKRARQAWKSSPAPLKAAYALAAVAVLAGLTFATYRLIT